MKVTDLKKSFCTQDPTLYDSTTLMPSCQPQDHFSIHASKRSRREIADGDPEVGDQLRPKTPHFRGSGQRLPFAGLFRIL